MFGMRGFPFLIAVLSTLLLQGCGGGGSSTRKTPAPRYPASPPITSVVEAKKLAPWTILVYLDADNDLEADGMLNLNQMEFIGSTREVRVIVQVDRISGFNSGYGDWTDTRRYLVIRDTNTSVFSSIRIDNPILGELDMADWHTLRDFVEWGTREFPADNYCLVMWDHGNGWQIRSLGAGPQFKYIISDDTSSNVMNVMDIPKALAGFNIDVLAFDACLMQQLEVAYELVGSARYMVGSAASEPAPGYNYTTLLSKLSGNTTGATLCSAIVEAYAETYPPPRKVIAQCALDLSKVSALATAAKNFARLLTTKGLDLSVARQTALNYSTAGGATDRHYLDLLDYAYKCTLSIGITSRPAYDSLSTALANATVAQSHGTDLAGSNGVGIYMPAPGAYDYRYEMLRFAADTDWDLWIKAQPK